jgi:hypothetical protein
MKTPLLAFTVLAGLSSQPSSAAGFAVPGGGIRACLMAAAETYALPPALLVIMLNVEGGRLGSVSRNTNKTVDIGPMQINGTWLPKLSAHWHAGFKETYIAARDNFCANIEGGAWILRAALDEANGNVWEGVALYHSHTEKHKLDYLQRVMTQVLRLRRQAVAELAQPGLGGQ